MKKRFMSLLLVLVMVFSLLPISAMAQVYIFEGDAIQLDFYRNSGDTKPFNTQRVQVTGDPKTVTKGAIYDPGCTLAKNEHFIGWKIEDVDGVKKTVEDVRAYINENIDKYDGNPVKLTAVVSPVHYVVYYGENDRVVKTDAVILAENGDNWNTTVNFDYVPVSVNSEFEGWTDVEGGTTKKYDNGDPIEASAEMTKLYPVCKAGFWVKFDENDKPVDPKTQKGNPDLTENIHATYQPPEFVEEGQTLTLDTNKYKVEASGYEFLGWFDAPDGDTRVTQASAGTTVYAHWKRNDSAAYTVIIWKQNVDGKTYDFEKSIPLTGNTGDTINTGSWERGSGNDAYARINSADYKYTGFHLQSIDSGKTIAPQGSTVVNVYYNRNQYTLTFKHSNTTIKTITALYGQFIGNQFPIVGSNGRTYPTGTRWKPQSTLTVDGTTYFTNNVVVAYIDVMTPGDMTFSFSENPTDYGYATRTMNYWIEALPGTADDGSDGMTTYKGKVYTQRKSVAAVYYGVTEEDYIDLNGFSHFEADKTMHGDYYYNSYNNQRATEVNFYYTRNKYDIKFMDGAYLNKRGEKVRESTNATLKTVSGIPYETDLAAYNEGGASFYDPTAAVSGYRFAGWYKDPDCTTPYTFDEMPSSNITVYAKWLLLEHRVQLVPNGGTLSGSDWFTVEENATISQTNPTRTDYDFIGWYTDEACTKRFNTDTKVNENTVTDKTWTEEDAPTVHGKLTLYAKWRRTMDSKTLLKVVYDAAGGMVNGQPTYSDPLSYADDAEAIAQPAATISEDGKTFSYWQVLGKDDKPTGVNVYPGDVFHVKLANAKESTEGENTINTVTLKAVYGVSKSTHIYWVGNGGKTADNETAVESYNANLNAAISVKPANTFTREGYVFLGWARLNEADMKDGDGWKLDNNLTAEDLWLTWDGKKYTAAKDNGETVVNPDIAANELQPYHVLYAVWDKIDNHNYVIDFNGKMTIATSATAKKDDSHNNGAFEVAGGVGTYQLDYQLSNTEAEPSTYRADLAFNGIDTALINGVPVGSAAGATASWEKYTVIPANNVYFDDSLVGKSMTAGDGSGYNVKVKDYESSPENGQEKTSLVFTFYGTGIDVYCTTDKDAGWIQANVDGTAYPFVNSRYQESEGSTTAIYNTPVISIDGLAPNVEHTLTLRTLTNSNFRLDGIRVYNAMQGVGDEATQAAVNKAYDDADESNAVFLEVRDRILAANKFVVDGASDANIPGPITGAVFLETQATGATIADYTAKGPKDEVYLAPGQAIAFNLGGWFADTYKVMVGLSMPKSTDSGTATVYASGHGTSNPIKVSARTDMFYQIYPDANGNVIIKNDGDGMISITKLKITTIAADGTAYTVPAQTTGEAVEPGTRGLQVNRSLMAYAMAFDPATEVSPTDNVEEPDTPEEPDDPKPGWNDGAFNPMSILKNLFQNLLDGLGKLFGNLPKW